MSKRKKENRDVVPIKHHKKLTTIEFTIDKTILPKYFNAYVDVLCNKQLDESTLQAINESLDSSDNVSPKFVLYKLKSRNEINAGYIYFSLPITLIFDTNFVRKYTSSGKLDRTFPYKHEKGVFIVDYRIHEQKSKILLNLEPIFFSENVVYMCFDILDIIKESLNFVL